ncbi:isochorismatase [Thermosynechococcus sp. JY1334]|uniref:isochorismatase n=1 Tax=unclassified Thermosynechococcus TaxID=2622553 RepID=UPI002673F508|nr:MULTISPECIES: isochorismatase [unclassified Thermosynechococcus]MDR5638070.1 isochorismatase [Thermosynechococcus sp. PP42]MDR7898928.1 isochorismatase [Thermosynechococcus sp. JY1332]MDR7906333.1 isochorismatase [Thermosynechococcus sp. JY1334]MDR7921273.1 isochorismatase [Thermosynechococcus sp. HY213]WKT86053.1 isochorismatase [Thermosynechococcus sp. JY1339]
MAPIKELPIPDFFDATKVAQVWRVPYQERAVQARQWAQQYQIPPAAEDRQRTILLLIDVQNTFCLPDFELFVQGAVADNQRLCRFIYTHLAHISEIIVTLDTHTASQIFHPLFWRDATGEPPPPLTTITVDDVERGRWQPNPHLLTSLGMTDQESLQAYARHYVAQLAAKGKFPLTIWPYHSMLGGIGHALVSAVEEACFFHTVARQQQTRIELKGSHPLTENYSVLRPEVSHDLQGRPLVAVNSALIEHLLAGDRLIIAGQAKSHCVAWTVADLLSEIQQRDPQLAQRVYLLEDCMSPVVVPGVVDFSETANATFAQFAAAGMHRISTSSASLNL